MADNEKKDETQQSNEPKRSDEPSEESARTGTEQRSTAPVSPQLLSEGGGTTGEHGQQPTSMARVLLFGVLGILIGAAVTSFLIHGSLFGGLLGEPVATVNGEDISREEYTEVYEQVAASAGVQTGTSTQMDEQTRAQLREQTLEILINRELLEQAARAAGMGPTSEEIEGEYEALVSQAGGDEAIEQIFASTTLTEATLRTDIERQLMIESYIDSEIGTGTSEVTEEEVREVYDGIQFGESEPIPFSDLRPQIEAQLAAQKRQEQVDALINMLREEAEIEQHI